MAVQAGRRLEANQADSRIRCYVATPNKLWHSAASHIATNVASLLLTTTFGAKTGDKCLLCPVLPFSLNISYAIFEKYAVEYIVETPLKSLTGRRSFCFADGVGNVQQSGLRSSHVP